MNVKTVMVRVDADLVQELKGSFAEAQGMTATGLVDWALRYLVKLEKAGYIGQASKAARALHGEGA